MSAKTTTEKCPDLAGWLEALSLTERIELLMNEGGLRAGTGLDETLGQKRLARWRSEPPFTDEDFFLKRLGAAGLSQEEFVQILSARPEHLQGRLPETPRWIAAIQEALTRPSPPESEDADSTPPQALRGQGFVSGLWPLIDRAVTRVRRECEALERRHSGLPFAPPAAINFSLPGLLKKLSMAASRTLVLELNVARLQGTLEGETPEQRFGHFHQQLEQPDNLLSLLREYPVLARQVVTSIDFWTRNCVELLSRLCEDWGEIVATLSPGEDPGQLIEISGDAGDSHREGRSVRVLHFQSGFKVVYKPHTLGIDVHFNQLLEWLNERGAGPPLRTLKVIDRGGYGWVEFVTAAGCSTEEEVARFYQRQGELLALLYTLDATDFHLENLIASGEHPVLVDLESLFHPRHEIKSELDGFTAAQQAFANSVMRIGLLPQRLWGTPDGDDAGIDISGMGGAAGQMTPFPVLIYENQATDEMRAVRKRVEMQGSQNQPSLDGQAVNLQEYKAHVLDGFSSMYGLLLRERPRLLADDGVLAPFADDEVRAILRPTRTYSVFLTESFHPDLQRNALDRSRVFDRLWGRAKSSPSYFGAVPAEIRDLEKGDVPFFSSRPDSRDLVCSDGRRVPEFFETSSLDVVRDRVSRLSTEDLSRQNWFISASIAALSPEFPGGTPTIHGGSDGHGVVTRERLLSHARAVADRLAEVSLRDGTSVNWIGLSFVNERHWTLLPLMDELYNGMTGVALFLAYAGDVLKDERYGALARTALDGAAQRWKRNVDRFAAGDVKQLALGGFSGAGGCISTLTHAGLLWNEPSYIETAESLAGLMSQLVEKDESLDIISGSAGAILNLLALHHCAGSEKALATAVRCAEHLLARSIRTDQGIAWGGSAKGSKPLTGFSHGNAGIAHALLELSAATGDERYRRHALEAFAYERATFSAEHGNWPDFRELDVKGESAEPTFMVTWCHGAPGIGLGRVRALRHVEDEAIHDEIEVAVRTTLAQGFGAGHSICHGDLGNLEFLFEAARARGDAALLAEVERKTAYVLDDIDRRGWVCGTPHGTETPGLMTGLAGIGYALLRLAEPERVPSVLTLAPPYGVLKAEPVPEPAAELVRKASGEVAPPLIR